MLLFYVILESEKPYSAHYSPGEVMWGHRWVKFFIRCLFATLFNAVSAPDTKKMHHLSITCPPNQVPSQTPFFSGCPRSSQRRKRPCWRSPCDSAAAPLSWWRSEPGAAASLPVPSPSWPCGGEACPPSRTNPRPLCSLATWPRSAGRIWPENCCWGRLQLPGRSHRFKEAQKGVLTLT